MTKSMSKMVVAVVALAAVFGAFSLADAQTDYTPTDPVTAEVRGSTFHPDPATANNGFLGFEDINPTASAEAIAAAAAADTTTTGGTGGGLAITGSEANLCDKALDEDHLSRVELASRSGGIAPLCSVNLRERLTPSGTRWPFDLEGVANNRVGIKVTGQRPCVHPLAAL
ncbi:hypothetical protein GQR58_030556 [Nymphon striatum]|nr:hypothetical protein GQR58_030556 [Nymphon striatum]